MLISLMFETLF